MDLKPAILERYEKLPKSNKIVADYFMTIGNQSPSVR